MRPNRQETTHQHSPKAEPRAATERRRQLLVLLLLAAAILLATVLLTGPRNIFLPHWWRIDLP